MVAALENEKFRPDQNIEDRCASSSQLITKVGWLIILVRSHKVLWRLNSWFFKTALTLEFCRGIGSEAVLFEAWKMFVERTLVLYVS